jgi:hypothetical protein
MVKGALSLSSTEAATVTVPVRNIFSLSLSAVLDQQTMEVTGDS